VVAAIELQIEALCGRHQVRAGHVQIRAEAGAQLDAGAEREAAADELEVVVAVVAAEEQRVGAPRRQLDPDVAEPARAAPGARVHTARARHAERRERQTVDVVGDVDQADADAAHAPRHVDQTDLHAVHVARHVHRGELQPAHLSCAIEGERALHAVQRAFARLAASANCAPRAAPST
jgi:hypothetical protein